MKLGWGSSLLLVMLIAAPLAAQQPHAISPQHPDDAHSQHQTVQRPPSSSQRSPQEQHVVQGGSQHTGLLFWLGHELLGLPENPKFATPTSDGAQEEAADRERVRHQNFERSQLAREQIQRDLQDKEAERNRESVARAQAERVRLEDETAARDRANREQREYLQVSRELEQRRLAADRARLAGEQLPEAQPGLQQFQNTLR